MTPSENTLFDLSNLCTLKINGAEAANFLQGQLSCDVTKINTQQMQPSALCNLKGRILALPDVLQFHDDLYLILPKNLLEPTQRSLSKTAALSRVTLESNNNYALFGFYLKDTNGPLPFDEGPWPTEPYAVLASDNACAYHLGNGFYIILADKNAAFIEQNKFESCEAWHQLRLAEKSVCIYPESRGLFLPHRLDLHLSGHLNFDKGCYRGQEIIARTHYRAKRKHALKLFTIKTNTPLHPGLHLMNDDNTQTIGELIDFCLIQDNQFLIAASVLLDVDVIKSINIGVAD
mgnify:CR=1 FL=1|jgi:tRNA-modifying protein YgfZ